MRRTASISFDAFDPEVQEAARDAARRAGVPVQEWLAATVAGNGSAPKAASKRRAAPPAFDADRAPPPRRGRRPAEAFLGETAALALRTPPAPVRQGPAPVVPQAPIEAHRGDVADRATEKQDPSTAAPEATSAVAPADAEAGQPQVAQFEAMLRRFETRIEALGERMTLPRALGRRGVPPNVEVRDAVAEIRRRQQELEAGEGEAIGQVDALQSEAVRLRRTVDGLANGRDVSVLETSVRTLAAEVGRARDAADLDAISGPIDLLRLQVARLANDVAADVHARVAADVERLTARIDQAFSAESSTGGLDARAMESLFRELDAMRREIASLADPQRIQALAQEVARLDAAVERLGGASAAEARHLAEMRPLLEDIRREVSAPRAGIGAALENRFDALGAKLDGLRVSPPASPTNDVLARIDALSSRIDDFATARGDAAIGTRLDRIDATLRSPAPAMRELAAIHSALAGIEGRIAQIAEPGGLGADALDALERQVVRLAARLDDRDPAIAEVERTLRDISREIAELRDPAPLAATVERATRAALAEAFERREPTGSEPAAVSDLKAQHEASEQRIQGTLEGVHTVLERLVDRLARVEAEQAAPNAPAPARRESPLPAAIPVRAPRPAAAEPAARSPSLDELLEPGAHRPVPPAVPEGADVKANFIAAARRAAQAAAAEAAPSAQRASPKAKAETRSAGKVRSEAGTREEASTAGGAIAARAGKLMRMRRSLVIGLAAAVLALGALKLGSGLVGGQAPEAAPPPPRPAAAITAPAPASDLAGLGKAEGTSGPAAEAPATPPMPAITEAPKSPPAPAAATRTESSLPKVPGMTALDADLAVVPGSLSGLRQAALAGDAAAVYDLAARASDGRGLPRDPKLAARLFEKVAATGVAPAEYRLGNLNEKGVGVAKDLGLARQLYGRAAEKGNVRAMHNLAVVLAESGAEAGKPDYAAAVTWFRKAAEYGIRDSQYNLAVLLARGLGTQQDLGQAYLWFAAAAAQGDDDAGRKRDEIGGKLPARDLETVRAQVAAWRPKTPDPAANDAPQSAATRAEAVASAKSMGTSLVGAPPPGGGRRVEMPAPARGKV